MKNLLLSLSLFSGLTVAGTVSWDHPSPAAVASYDVSMCWDSRPCVDSNTATTSAPSPAPPGKSLRVTVKPVPVSPTNTALTGTGTFSEPAPGQALNLRLAPLSLKVVKLDTNVPNPVDLAAGGPIDWVFWDYLERGIITAANNGNMTAGLTKSIPLSVVSPTSGPTYSYTNGYPEAAGSSDSVMSSSTTGSGFFVTMKAGVQRCTAEIYLGGKDVTGQVTASIGDGSSLDYTSSQTFAGEDNRRLTLDFEPAAASDVRVEWVKTGGTGDIRFAAATYQCAAGSGPTLGGTFSIQPAVAIDLDANSVQGKLRWDSAYRAHSIRKAGGDGVLSFPRPDLLLASNLDRFQRSTNEADFFNTPFVGWSGGGSQVPVQPIDLSSLLKVRPPGVNSGFKVSAKGFGSSDQKMFSVWFRLQKTQATIQVLSNSESPIEVTVGDPKIANEYFRADVAYALPDDLRVLVRQVTPTGISVNAIAAALY